MKMSFGRFKRGSITGGNCLSILKKIPLLLLFLTLTLAMAQGAEAADRSWRGTTSTDHTDVNNWSDTDGGATPATSVPGTYLHLRGGGGIGSLFRITMMGT